MHIAIAMYSRIVAIESWPCTNDVFLQQIGELISKLKICGGFFSNEKSYGLKVYKTETQLGC